MKLKAIIAIFITSLLLNACGGEETKKENVDAKTTPTVSVNSAATNQQTPSNRSEERDADDLPKVSNSNISNANRPEKRDADDLNKKMDADDKNRANSTDKNDRDRRERDGDDDKDD